MWNIKVSFSLVTFKLVNNRKCFRDVYRALLVIRSDEQFVKRTSGNVNKIILMQKENQNELSKKLRSISQKIIPIEFFSSF